MAELYFWCSLHRSLQETMTELLLVQQLKNVKGHKYTKKNVILSPYRADLDIDWHSDIPWLSASLIRPKIPQQLVCLHNKPFHHTASYTEVHLQKQTQLLLFSVATLYGGGQYGTWTKQLQPCRNSSSSPGETCSKTRLTCSKKTLTTWNSF